MAVRLAFRELLSEIDAIRSIARGYLAPGSDDVLARLKEDLRSIRSARSGVAYPWEIPEDWPLQTRPSPGKFMKGGGGKHSLFAEITSVWGVHPLGPHGRKQDAHRKLLLDSKASTRVRLRMESTGDEVAMWRMEIADSGAPGCYFHVQVLGEAGDGPFPNWLPIPRLPGFVATPMLVLEFVLGELFQDDWPWDVSRGDYSHQWRDIQLNRFRSLLDWQREVIGQSTGSPWTAIKLAKPTDGLFLA